MILSEMSATFRDHALTPAGSNECGDRPCAGRRLERLLLAEHEDAAAAESAGLSARHRDMSVGLADDDGMGIRRRRNIPDPFIGLGIDGADRGAAHLGRARDHLFSLEVERRGERGTLVARGVRIAACCRLCRSTAATRRTVRSSDCRRGASICPARAIGVLAMTLWPGWVWIAPSATSWRLSRTGLRSCRFAGFRIPRGVQKSTKECDPSPRHSRAAHPCTVGRS
jgi:hypothetical protein